MAIQSMDDVLAALRDIHDYLGGQYIGPMATAAPKPPLAATPTGVLGDFNELKSLLNSDAWPAAVPPTLLTNNDQDKEERAASMQEWLVDEMNANLEGKTLDFGCGEGHLVMRLKGQNHNAVGYDIKKSGPFNWGPDDPLTTDLDRIKSGKPYKNIILYDVMDHATNPQDVLAQVMTLMDAETKVHVRFHPFISRHGGHLYNQINKAWVHLIFTPEELALMGYTPEFVYFVDRPILTYGRWLAAAGFTFPPPRVLQGDIEGFFRQGAPHNRIVAKFGFFPEYALSQLYDDFTAFLPKEGQQPGPIDQPPPK